MFATHDHAHLNFLKKIFLLVTDMQPQSVVSLFQLCSILKNLSFENQ